VDILALRGVAFQGVAGCAESLTGDAEMKGFVALADAQTTPYIRRPWTGGTAMAEATALWELLRQAAEPVVADALKTAVETAPDRILRFGSS